MDETERNDIPWLGILGALIGTIPGVIVWAIAGTFGVHLAWAGQIHNALKDTEYALSLGECIARLYELLGLLELRGKFVGSVLKGYLFSALGGFGIFAKAAKS
ncbi:MAG: hypothetical protein IKN55_07980 [Oscillospiraceae bacterium]|nr:hypothetical protein [Oscillospiraceae bacterium]